MLENTDCLYGKLFKLQLLFALVLNFALSNSLLLCLLLPGALARILRRSCLHYANFSYVRSNKILEGSLLGTFSNHSPDQCEARCVHEYFCKSINVQIADPKTCQLNGDSESDASDYVTLTTKSGWTFKSTNFSEPNVSSNLIFLFLAKAWLPI